MAPLGKAVSGGSGRKFVIGDVHGCLLTLKALLKQLHLTQDDQLFLLGDYVNKGPASRKVLDLIIQLQNDYQLYPLLGNHDQIVLDYLNGVQNTQFDQITEDLLHLNNLEKEQYLIFLNSLYHYLILDEFILVHAGFDFTLQNPFIGKEDMLNIREFKYNSSKVQNKTIIHGHYPRELAYIQTRLEQKSKIIPLDNGCVYADRPGQGNLLCLELTTMTLLIQRNCESQT